MITLWISVISIVLLTSLTGAVMVVLWYVIGLILERLGFANIVFELLKMAASFFIIPFAFIAWKVYELELGKGYLLSPTPAIVQFCKCATIIWCVGAGMIFVILILSEYRLTIKYRNAFPCEKEVQEMFEDIKKLLKIRCPLLLGQCYKADSACIIHIFKPMVILPVEEFSKEDLRIILIHEMMHFKQKDVLWKLIAYILLAVHFFNPFVWILYIKVQKWSEFSCDLKSVQYAPGIKEYFDVLLKCVTTDEPIKSGLTSHLVGNQHELMERARKIMKISKRKKRSKWMVVLVLCTAFMLSSTTVCAATVECADAYVDIAFVTTTEHTESVDNSTEIPEYTEYGDSEKILIKEEEYEEGGFRADDVTAYSWDVPAGYRIYGEWFNCTAGQDLVVTAVMSPTTVDVRVGIEDSTGYRRYVVANDYVTHLFDITSSGQYRIYIQNNTNTDVHVAGSFITR